MAMWTCDAPSGLGARVRRYYITLEPGKRNGQPCIRGMRMTVQDVLQYLASGMSVQEVLDDFPYLTREEIQACLAYAAALQRTA